MVSNKKLYVNPIALVELISLEDILTASLTLREDVVSGEDEGSFDNLFG